MQGSADSVKDVGTYFDEAGDEETNYIFNAIQFLFNVYNNFNS